MKFSILIKYYHPELAIVLEYVRNAWWLPENLRPVKLKTISHQRRLAYRFPSSGKRVSYLTLKKGLIKKSITIKLSLELLPF